MRQTNYQLFDFLDLSPALNENERLWIACKPTDISVVNGEIYVEIPFQLQMNSNDIKPDFSVDCKKHILRIRAFNDKILRVYFSAYDKLPESSEMLQLDVTFGYPVLSVLEFENGYQIVDDKGVKRAEINLMKCPVDWWSDLLPAPEESLQITFYPDGKNAVALSSFDVFSPGRFDSFPLAYVEKDGVPVRTTCAFHTSPDAAFFGTGERFTKLDLSGKTFQLRNQDGQGVNNRRTYKNIPFYLSSERYGLFLHTSSFAKFSLADHSSRAAQMLVDEDALDLFLLGGDSPAEIIRSYHQLTGFPQMPPLWSFGVWMSRMTYFSADEVNEICDRLRTEKYPCDVIHLDTGWFETDWLCEWKFNKERFPDPKGFIHHLRENGFKVSLWQLPYISYQAAQYEEADANQFISKSERKISGGSNFSVQDYAGTIDFTYDKATQWYKGLLKNLLEMGVTCIKADFGEDIHVDAEYHAMKPAQLHNLYPLLYQKAAYEITKEVTGDGIIWARAGWAGCQRFPLHWGGDSAATWDGLAGSLKGGLQIGLSGFAFWSHDVPGFHGVSDFMNAVIPEDLYMRWTQFGVFSSHIRYHGTSKREPWHFPGIAALIKKWWNLRYALIPYIIDQSRKSIESGLPLLRALYFHHPEDKTCRHIDDQYYFGDDMLVAPVMNSKGLRDIYLPDGEWVHFFSKEKFKGNQWLKQVSVPLDEMPVFVKSGATVPMYPEEVQNTDEMDMEKVIKIQY
jgi:alpha-D-xyloside xylohydrolase